MQRPDALGPTPIEVVLGPDLYLFGEETGLEEVIEGRLPLPRIARPFMFGLFAQPPNDNPTLVNNVETLANVAAHPRRRPRLAPLERHRQLSGNHGLHGLWRRAHGRACSSCRSGRRSAHLVEDRAGGPPEGRSLKAIFPGASNTVLAPSELDVPMDFDSMRAGRIRSRVRRASRSSTIRRAW